MKKFFYYFLNYILLIPQELHTMYFDHFHAPEYQLLPESLNPTSYSPVFFNVKPTESNFCCPDSLWFPILLDTDLSNFPGRLWAYNLSEPSMNLRPQASATTRGLIFFPPLPNLKLHFIWHRSKRTFFTLCPWKTLGKGCKKGETGSCLWFMFADDDKNIARGTQDS